MQIDKIFLKSTDQLNALARLKCFLENEERKVLVYSSDLSNFNYCLLFWMLANANSLHEIEAIHKRAWHFMLNDYEISYEYLLDRSGKLNTSLLRTRTLCREIYKAVDGLNPEIMKNQVKVRKTNGAHRQECKLNLEIPKSIQVSFCTKSLRIQGPTFWAPLPFHIKSKENL